MITITTRNRCVQLPECVDELTPAQYQYLLFLAATLNCDAIDVQYFGVRWLSHLLGLGRLDYTRLRPEFIAEIESQTEGFIDGWVSMESGTPAPKLATTCNLWQEYEGYKGPGDWLNGATFGEVVECTTMLSMPAADEAERSEHYSLIARKLYRLPDDVKLQPLFVQHCVLLLSTVWKAIQSGPIEINGQMLDCSIIFKNSGPRRPDDKTGWTGVTFEVAQAGLFGRVPDVEASDFWAVLIYLYKCKFEYNHEQSQLNHKK